MLEAKVFFISYAYETSEARKSTLLGAFGSTRERGSAEEGDPLTDAACDGLKPPRVGRLGGLFPSRVQHGCTQYSVFRRTVGAHCHLRQRELVPFRSRSGVSEGVAERVRFFPPTDYPLSRD